MSKLPLFTFSQHEPGKSATFTLYEKEGWGQITGPRGWTKQVMGQMRTVASSRGYDMPGVLDGKGKSGVWLVDLHFKRRARR